MTVRRYFTLLWQSLSSASFYRNALKWPFAHSLLFFVVTLALLGGIRSIFFITVTLPELKNHSHQALTEFQQHIPNDLVITWDGQKLTSTPFPLTIGYPSKLDTERYALPPQLGMIITNDLDSNLIEPAISESLIVVTDTELILNSENNDAQTFLLIEALGTTPFVVTNETLPGQLQQVREFGDSFFFWLAVASPLLFAVLTPVTIFVVGVFESLLLFILQRIYQRTLTYEKTLQFSLHVVLTAEIISQLVTYLYPNFQYSMLSVSFWLITLYLAVTLRGIIPRKTVLK